MSDNVVPFRPRPVEQPDASCRWVDERGVEWFKFGCDYDFDGSQWSFEVWALNWADAEARIKAIASNGKVTGQLYAIVEAGDVTTESLLNAGAVLAQPVERPICKGEDAGSTPAHSTIVPDDDGTDNPRRTEDDEQ